MGGNKLRFVRKTILIFLLAPALLCPAGLTAAQLSDQSLDQQVIWYEDDQKHIPEPEERDPHLIWDMVEDTAVLPVARFLYPGRFVRSIGTLFGGDHVPPAGNVNVLDEVPNSTWFTNRIGLFPWSPGDIARGPGTGDGPDKSSKWTIISAKTEGVTPGFIIRDGNGDTFLIKFDPPGYPGMTSAAGVISNRLLYGAGYNVPDDAVVTFRREDLVLGEKVKLKQPDGTKRLMLEEDINDILASVNPPIDDAYRAISSRFVSGKPIGPFNYIGRRKDDPNDKTRHEDRRELRGFRLFAAWINHFDTKQHNSLDAYVTENGRSFIRHYFIDFASTLGAGAKGPAPRYGFEFTVDTPATLGRMLALGFHEDAWRMIARPEGLEEVAYFESTQFDAMEFKPFQPNSAFANMTRMDGYWAAKIISAFTNEHLVAIVEQARYRNPDATAYVAGILGERRDKIARQQFDKTPPLDFFSVQNGTVRFHDLGEERGIYPGTEPVYRARSARADNDRSTHAWSEWKLLNKLSNEAVSKEIRDLLDVEWPYIAVDCQVNRGNGWSSSVRIYIDYAASAVVAVER